MKAENAPRILMFSQRNILKNFFLKCSLYEFEDIIRRIDSVDMSAPERNRYYKFGFRIANKVAKHSTISLNPGIRRTKVDKYYDLFVAICQFPKDLLMVNTLVGWEDYCKKSICWIDEIWKNWIENSRSFNFDNFARILSKFDFVVSCCKQAVEGINKRIPGQCLYLPPAVDAFLFCPYPNPPIRFIDVYSIGRRSGITHQALLRMAEEDGIFYVYDTIIGKEVLNTREHRFLIANMAQRSRYFIANSAKINDPNVRSGQDEIPLRFFEGAASGCILIGDFPANGEFKKIFHWPGALNYLAFDSEDIDRIIRELDTQNERQKQARRNNIVHSLLEHDWCYRWERILEIVGLDPRPELILRKNRLKNLAKMVELS